MAFVVKGSFPVTAISYTTGEAPLCTGIIELNLLSTTLCKAAAPGFISFRRITFITARKTLWPFFQAALMANFYAALFEASFVTADLDIRNLCLPYFIAVNLSNFLL